MSKKTNPKSKKQARPLEIHFFHFEKSTLEKNDRMKWALEWAVEFLSDILEEAKDIIIINKDVEYLVEKSPEIKNDVSQNVFMNIIGSQKPKWHNNGRFSFGITNKITIPDPEENRFGILKGNLALLSTRDWEYYSPPTLSVYILFFFIRNLIRFWFPNYGNDKRFEELPYDNDHFRECAMHETKHYPIEILDVIHQSMLCKICKDSLSKRFGENNNKQKYDTIILLLSKLRELASLQINGEPSFTVLENAIAREGIRQLEQEDNAAIKVFMTKHIYDLEDEPFHLLLTNKQFNPLALLRIERDIGFVSKNQIKNITSAAKNLPIRKGLAYLSNVRNLFGFQENVVHVSQLIGTVESGAFNKTMKDNETDYNGQMSIERIQAQINQLVKRNSGEVRENEYFSEACLSRIHLLSFLKKDLRQALVKFSSRINSDHDPYKIVIDFLRENLSPLIDNRIIELIAAAEPLLLQNPRYRDHLIHQFQVFVLGCIILDRCYRTLSRCLGLDITTPDNNNTRELHKILDNTWLVASTLHDFCYILQQWDELTGKLVSSLLQIETDKTHNIIRNVVGEDRNLKFHLKEYANKCHELGIVHSELDFFNFTSNEQFSNHGILGGLSILQNKKANNTPIDYKSAAIAIMIHDSNVYKKQLNTEAKMMLLNPIVFETHPIPFLLLLCDALQDWGRPTKNLSISDERLLKQPELVFGEFKSNSIQLKLRYTRIDINDTITSERWNDKKEELGALSRILKSNIFKIDIIMEPNAINFAEEETFQMGIKNK